VELAPERGAEIRHIGRPGGANVLATYDWRSPLRASRSSSYGDGTSDWLSEYRGAWQELFPNAGPAATVGGVTVPFHGEVSTAQWDVLERSPTRVVLEVAARLPLILRRVMTLHDSRPILYIAETVTSDSGEAAPFLWGHHPAFSTPAGTCIDLPAGELDVDPGMNSAHHDLQPGASGRWPQAPSREGENVRLDRVPDTVRERLCYLRDVREGWAALRDPGTGRGVALAWDAVAFPHVWFWQQLHGPGFPWYGRAAITAIEPHSAWPSAGLAVHQEQGTATVLAPGAERSAWLTVALFEATERAVVQVEPGGTVVTEEENR
jgi:galactose mutarotase-like enzyme